MTSWAENNISRQDFSSMQHDALRRVREMERQAMENLQKTQSSFNTSSDFNPEDINESTSETIHTQNKDEPGQNRHNNSQNNNFVNNGMFGQNPNFSRPPFPNNQQNFGERKSPLDMLGGLFSKGGNKGGLSDMLNGLIPKRGGDSPISKILDALDLDTEKIILIVLILLLLNDGADYTLILALGYILL